MNTSTFLTHFQLFKLGAESPTNVLLPQKSLTESSLKKSAVLIALIEKNNELQVILTKRAAHLKHHAGQISFVGGKVDRQDRSVIETALREAEEEIALPRSHVHIVGQLSAMNTLTGFIIYPVVALIKQPFQAKIDSGEVAEVFQIPLRFFLDPQNRYQQLFLRRGHAFNIHFMPWQEKLIWGATAAILNQLCEQISLDH